MSATELRASTGATEEVTQFLAALRSTKDIERFVNMELFELIPTLWGDDHDAYARWKFDVAQGLEVDASCLVVVGSAALGVSLNPKNAFRGFNETSDVDLAVVDSHHFDVAWRCLRRLSPSLTLRRGGPTRDAVDRHRKGYVFEGTIATDSFLELLPFASAWVSTLERVRHDPPVAGRTINARLYRDYDALRAYQLKSVRQARDRLLEGWRLE